MWVFRVYHPLQNPSHGSFLETSQRLRHTLLPLRSGLYSFGRDAAGGESYCTLGSDHATGLFFTVRCTRPLQGFYTGYYEDFILRLGLMLSGFGLEGFRVPGFPFRGEGHG